MIFNRLRQARTLTHLHAKKPEHCINTVSPTFHFSERAGIRTPDNWIKSQVLYQLSYTPLFNYILLLQGKCPEPESNQRHEDFQSSALPTELSGLIHKILCKLREQDLNLRPSGYEPDELPDCSLLRYEIKIISFEIKPMIGLEPITC